VALALSALPVAMIDSHIRASLVAAVGGAVLTAARFAPKSLAATALPRSQCEQIQNTAWHAGLRQTGPENYFRGTATEPAGGL
jgi:hypothetical protein